MTVKPRRKCCGNCQHMDLGGHKRPSASAIYECIVPIGKLPTLPSSVLPPRWPPHTQGVDAWTDGDDCPLYLEKERP